MPFELAVVGFVLSLYNLYGSLNCDWCCWLLHALKEDMFVCLCIKDQSCLYKQLNNLCFQLFFSFIGVCMKLKGLALYVCVCVRTRVCVRVDVCVRTRAETLVKQE